MLASEVLLNRVTDSENKNENQTTHIKLTNMKTKLKGSFP